MKKPYITPENADAIDALLSGEEGKATARTLDYSGLARLIAKLEANPAVSLLPKKHRRGVSAVLQEGHPLPSAYTYPADATSAMVEWGPAGWRLVGAGRVANRDRDQATPYLPPAVAEEAHRRFSQLFVGKGEPGR